MAKSTVKKIQRITRAYSGIPLGNSRVAKGYQITRKSLADKIRRSRKGLRGYAAAKGSKSVITGKYGVEG